MNRRLELLARYIRFRLNSLWFVQDICGILCAILSWALMLYAEYVIMFVILWPNSDVYYKYKHATFYQIFAFLAFASHIRTMLTDPGAVPKGNAVTEGLPNIRNGQILFKCPKCCSIKPERAHHCSVCQRCIKKMDHHCPWVNNCVGENNQKYFVLFTLYITIISSQALYLAVRFFTRCIVTDWAECHVHSRPATIIMLLFLSFEALLFSVFTFIMFVTQLQAIWIDVTGIEQLKKESSHRKISRLRSVQSIFGRFSLSWFSPFTSSRRHHYKIERGDLYAVPLKQISSIFSCMGKCAKVSRFTIISLVLSCAEGSVGIKVFTRFTEEIFSSLISMIYIWEESLYNCYLFVWRKFFVAFWGLRGCAQQLLVQLLMFLRLLSRTHALGDAPHIIEVKEQRVSALIVSTLVGLSVLMGKYLEHVPMAVLFGVFLYMGISSIQGIQIFDRIILILMPSKHHPPVAYVRKVRTWKIHLFTTIQLISLGVLWTIQSSFLGLLFPFFLLLMIPLRKVLNYFYLPDEMLALILVLALLVFVPNNNCYFFGRWFSATSKSTSDGLQNSSPMPSVIKLLKKDEYRKNDFSWSQSQIFPVQSSSYIASDNANNRVQSSTVALPMPFALHFPQQMIPVAILPAFPSRLDRLQQPVVRKSQSQSSSAGSSSSGVPIMVSHVQMMPKSQTVISDGGPPTITLNHYQNLLTADNYYRRQQNAATTYPSVPAAQLVPCLCNGQREQYRWPKNTYPANIYDGNTPFFQAIHLLPCYCPVIRDIDPQVFQQISQIEQEQTTSNTLSSSSYSSSSKP